MFSDTIAYEDFDGNQRTDTLFFNISQTEGLKLQTSKEGGYTAYMQEVIDEFSKASNGDDYGQLVATSKMFNIFEDIILKSYGEKSDDGKRFMKSEEITDRFSHSAVYDAFLMKLVTDPEYALRFIVSVLPNNTGMSSEDLMAQAISDANKQDLNDRFKAKIEEKKTDSSATLPA